jgi:MerR family transcriptional regulator, light-induced transcriptional regulator
MNDTQPKHPIAIAAARSGLSQDILRVWERRYQAVEPNRGLGGHRAYSDADITRLRLLRAVTSAGRSIGQVARLSTRELSRLAEDDTAARAEREHARDAGQPRDASADAADIVERALETMRRLDAVDLEHRLRRAIAQLGITPFIEDVASPMLRRIGEEWHAGRLTIAHEHLASSTIHDIIAESMRAMARGSGDATVLVATPTGERHAIGAALVGATAASEGWRVLYLGADLPASEIAAAAIATKARAVAVSSIYVQDRARTLGELRALRALLPSSVSLIVGGGGVAGMEGDLAPLGIRVGASLRDLRDALSDVWRDVAGKGAA